jgi:uncharacterized protein YunC (DUF1805 family)
MKDEKGPLVVLTKAEKGFIVRSNFSMKALEEKGVAAARIAGISSIETALETNIVEITSKAKELGLREGMTVRKALEKILLKMYLKITRVGQTQLSYWRRVSQSEIRNSAATEKSESESEGGQKFLPPNPLPFCPPKRSVLVLPSVARQSVVILFKMSSDFFQQTPPKFISSEICLARGFAPRFGG